MSEKKAGIITSIKSIPGLVEELQIIKKDLSEILKKLDNTQNINDSSEQQGESIKEESNTSDVNNASTERQDENDKKGDIIQIFKKLEIGISSLLNTISQTNERYEHLNSIDINTIIEKIKIVTDKLNKANSSIDDINNLETNIATINSIVNELTKKTSSTATEINNISNRTAEITEQFNIFISSSTEKLNSALSTATKQFEDNISSNTEQLNSVLSTATERLGNSISSSTEQLNNKLIEVADNVKKNIDARLNNDSIVADKIGTLDEKIAALDNMLNLSGEYNSLKSKYEESNILIKQQEEAIAALNKKIEEATQKEFELNTNIENLNGNIYNLNEEIKTRDQKINELENRANEVFDSLGEVNERNKDLNGQLSSLFDEIDSLHTEFINFINYNRIKSAVELLHKNINTYYSSSDVIYSNANDIKQGADRFEGIIEDIINNSETNKSELIRKELISRLSSNSWINIVIRLNAYTKLEIFNATQAIKNNIINLSNLIVGLYKKFDIDIIVPELLKEDFDKDRFEYSNDETTWISHLCNVNPAEYRGKVFDIIRAGYGIYNSEGVYEQRKPVVYYY